ncbi:MAG: Holliday junction branch migration protein RuvA [Candidatus Marinimicrobia bacterium]|nr:Holliday junction branch migration protein RuvA [Candidatus Neomarinimicrobiota bacterium]
MYEYLSGKLVQKRPDLAVIDVQGVGYKLRITSHTYESLPKTDSPIKLFTHLNVREDALELYGFGTEDERTFFHELLLVSKIGPKAAANILSGGTPGDIQRMVLAEDVKSLSTLPGVGATTARRLVAELKSRLEKVDFSSESQPKLKMSGLSSSEAEAVLALEALGYSRTEAQSTIARLGIAADDKLSTQEIIKKALQRGKT